MDKFLPILKVVAAIVQFLIAIWESGILNIGM